jgi:Ca2+-transporting ATPase
MDRLHRAGLQTIMLTGDQSATAQAVAEQVGLSVDAVTTMDSADLERLPAVELGAALRHAHAFARISPSQKLQIVRALQDSGAIVAMIGDGINDSPALRAANIGIAFGSNGAEAAREVADVYLASDDLATLLHAIERGRTTYANVRKAIHYLLGTNTSEILLMLAGTAAGFPEILSPMQLLWVNLVSDVLPGIGLAFEAPERDIMELLPRPAAAPIVGPDDFGRLAADASIIATGALTAGLYGALRHGIGSPVARTITFGSLVTAQLLHALTCRSATAGVFGAPGSAPNPALSGILSGSFVAQSAAMLVPGLRRLLGVAPLGPMDALVSVAGGILPFVVNEALKAGRASSTSETGLFYTCRGEPDFPILRAAQPIVLSRGARSLI